MAEAKLQSQAAIDVKSKSAVANQRWLMVSSWILIFLVQ